MLLAALLLSAVTQASDDGSPANTDVFVSGEGGYHTYRIPAVVATNSGTLLAFCEGRRAGSSDTGDIDLLVTRSANRGATWAEPTVVWDDGKNVCGNPCPVVDRRSGTVFLLLTWNAGDVHESKIAPGHGNDSRRVFVTSSTDDGVSWESPREITAAVKDPRWSWYATGPGAGIQLERGAHRGRLVVPCDHKLPVEDGVEYRSHVIFSDDRGATWQRGGSAPEPAVNECEVAELEDGRLLLNMRNYDREQHARQVAESHDGGRTFVNQRFDAALVEPICQASLRRYRWGTTSHPGVLLFSNPASTQRRERLTVRASLDDGATWPHERVLHEGPGAYSCLVTLPDGTLGCFFEADGYGRLVFSRFTLDWLLGR